jgi:hypothetical protein
MQDDRARLLETPRRDLESARHDRLTWSRLAFTAEHADDGRVFDGNRVARFGVLWAAQYDRRSEDLALLRFLLEQEIVRYRETVPWGLAPDLELAGLLVAEHRQLQDVWLHWQAKEISFDTALGYRTYYLLTAGVAATVTAVQASDHPHRDRILREITATRNADGTPRFTDAAVDDWLAAQRTRFPDRPEAEDLRTWANHAARVGEPDLSRRFILRWADQQPRTWQMLNSLQSHLAGLGFLDEAIPVQVEAVAITEPGWGKASALLRLIKLHRWAGHFPEARQALQDCAEVMPIDDSWRQAGLWRYFVKEYFLLVLMAPDDETAQRLVHEGDHQMRGITRLWMDGVLDAAIKAAEHTGQQQLRDRFLQVQADEQRARDEEIAQANSHRTTDNPSGVE